MTLKAGDIVRYNDNPYIVYKDGETLKLRLLTLGLDFLGDTGLERTVIEIDMPDEEEITKTSGTTATSQTFTQERDENLNVYLGVGTMGGVRFENSPTLSLTTEDNQNYVAVGELAKMTTTQSQAFWGTTEYVGSLYIQFFVRDIGEENPVVRQGWVSDKDSSDYQTEKSGSTLQGKILAITMGDTLREDLNGCYVWKCELTNGEVYTVDLTAQASRVGN